MGKCSNAFFSETTSIIALLPLSHNEASIVWSAENHLADELLALSPEAFAKRLSAGCLSEYYKQWLFVDNHFH
jgi:2-polyprenyl-6-methoxyphenol hydroxylase-like FAD-dependent oxidoreductase